MRIERTAKGILVHNGNYFYFVDTTTGEKIRVVPEPPALPTYPETVDLKITNTCFGACPWCHENSTPKAPKTDWKRLKRLLESFPGGIEVAIGGGDPIECEHLEEALRILRNTDNIPSLTVNTRTLVSNGDKLRQLLKKNLLHGVGISVSSPKELDESLSDILSYKNTVLHVIAGITSSVSLEKIIEKYIDLTNKQPKLLILGYKNFGRGVLSDSTRLNVQNKLKSMREWLQLYFSGQIDGPELVSFDTRGVRQLNIPTLVDDYARNFMGEDGEFSMYINAHEQYVSLSSACSKSLPIEEDDTLESLFQKIGALKNKEECATL